MARIQFLPDEIEVEAGAQETILEASLRAGINHAHACGGKAQCSTCRVWVLEGLEHCAPRSGPERRLAEPLHLDPKVRLACQTRVSGGVTLRRLVLDEADLEVVSQLGRGTTSHEGEEKRAAIMFADIRGFTSFSEPLPPYDTIFILNRFFNQMGKAIYAHGGYIDNYMGDGLLALFGVGDGKDGVEPEKAAEQAVRAGLGMLEAMDEMRTYRVANYGKGLDMGIGVHYGPIVVGTVGCLENQRLSAIGDSVNFASRIESANKEAGTRFLVSEETQALVKDRVRFGRRTSVEVKGKTGKYTVFEVVGLTGDAARDGEAAESSAIKEDGMVWLPALEEERLGEGARQVVKVGGMSVFLTRHKGRVFAIVNQCPHMGLPLNRAKLTDDLRLQCPWHHSTFSLETGEIKAWAPWPPFVGPALGAMRPRRTLRLLPTRTQEGAVWVAATDASDAEAEGGEATEVAAR